MFHWRAVGRFLILAVPLGSIPVLAQTPFNHAGLDGLHPPSSSIPTEQVDPASGSLTVVATDLTLPGNAGLDVVVQRVYNSAVYPDYASGSQAYEEDSWAGIGWRLHFGRILHADSQSAGQMQVEMGDGSRRPLYHSLANPNIWTTTDFWLYNPTDHTLQIPDGRTYTFGRDVTLNSRLGDVRYVTQIQDAFGNRITFSYFNAPGPIDGVSQITQYIGTETRQVTFAYDGTLHALSSMTYNGHTWHYDQVDAGGGYSKLTAVHPPIGVGPSYSYGGSDGLAGELTTLHTGLGGNVGYVYADSVRQAGTYSTTTRVVTSRSVSGRDVTNGTWTFAYGTGTNHDTTVVTCPCGTTRYKFYGTGTSGDFAGWSAGTVTDVSIEDGATVVEHRVMTYVHSDKISDDPVSGPNGTWSDAVVYRPLLKTVAITRGPTTWTTTYGYNTGDGTFNDFGQPATVHTGSGAYTYKDSTRTFQTNFTGYIGPKLASDYWRERYSYGNWGNAIYDTWSYDTATGFLTHQSTPATSATFEKDTHGNVSARIDGMGHRTTYEYDWGVVDDIQTPHQHSTFSIMPEGLVSSATVGGVATTYAYDASLRPTTITSVGNNPITLEYDNTGGTFVRVARGQSQTQYDLDGLGQNESTSNQVQLKSHSRRDACGRVLFQSAPYKDSLGTRGTFYVYDVLGRPTQITDPAGNVTTISYSGARVVRTDAENRTTTYDYLGLTGPDDGRVADVIDASGTTTTYTYTSTGQLTSVTGPNPGITRTWNIDDTGRPLSDTQPESGTTTYTYDADGNLKTVTAANTEVTTFTYDEDDRLTGRAAPGDVDDLAITYDANGHVATLTNGQSSTDYTYDAAGRLASRADHITGLTFTSTYTYDANDNLATLTYPSGRVVSYAYDAENRLLSVTQQPNGGSATSFATNFSYGDNGALASYVTGAVTHTFTYDTDDRIANLTAKFNGNGLDLTYGYDDVGNVQAITDPRPGANQTFSVDPLDRLTVANGPWGSLSWTYDKAGNRLTETGAAVTSYTYDAPTQRLASTTGANPESFGYDPLGRLTSDAFGTYTYTPTSRLATATSAGVSASFAYDASGERLAKTVNGTTTYTVRAPDGRTLSEYEASCGTPVWTRDVIYAGGTPVGAVKAVQVRPTVSVSSTTLSGAEGSGTVTVSFALTTSAPLACPVTASYHTVGATAGAGADFTDNAGTVVFPAGSVDGATQTVTVAIADDALNEDGETFSVDLTSAIGADLGANAQTVVTITDDDPIPSVTIGSVSVQEGASGTTNAVFPVTLSAASGRSVAVTYATSDGTAIAGQDYAATTGTLTIPPGNPSATIVVPVTGDHLPEPDETFTLQLSSPVNATIATGQATGTIVNDDILSIGLSANRTLPLAAGTAITWTASASGGAAPYQYQFRLWDSTVGWRTVQMYSTTATFTWAPAHAGTYQVEVWVLDAGSTAASDGTKQSAQFTITAAPAVTVTSFTADHTFPVNPGTAVRWTAVASGGVAPLQYRFIVYDPAVGWSTLQEYGSSNSVIWIPQHSGTTYSLQVWVRAAGSTASYDAWLGSGSVPVGTTAPALVSVTPDHLTPIAPGTPVVWTAVAAGGTTPISYEFWLYRQSTGVWTLVQAYGPSATWAWTAPSSPDTYIVEVWIKEQSFPGDYENWMNSATVTVASGAVSAVSLTSTQVAPMTPGMPITWTAQASGGTAPLLYRFFRYDLQTQTWIEVQGWSASRTYTWTPTASDFGTHALQVWVKSTGSAADWEAWTGTGYLVIVP